VQAFSFSFQESLISIGIYQSAAKTPNMALQDSGNPPAASIVTSLFTDHMIV
jgi:hypothetical protein